MQVDIEQHRVHKKHAKFDRDQQFVTENPNQTDALDKSKSLVNDAHHVVVLEELPLPGENSGFPFQLALLLKEEFLIHTPNPDKVDCEFNSEINL